MMRSFHLLSEKRKDCFRNRVFQIFLNELAIESSITLSYFLLFNYENLSRFHRKYINEDHGFLIKHFSDFFSKAFQPVRCCISI